MNKKINLIYLLLTIILYIGCNDAFFFSQEEQESFEIQLKSVTDGDIIATGEPITFEIVTLKESANPSSLEITIFQADGKIVGSNIIDKPEVNEELLISTNGIIDGFYEIEFNLYLDNELSVNKKVPFFITSQSYSLLGINSFPPIIVAGSKVLLKTDFSAPIDSNPYFRWSQNDSIIAQGLKNDGSGQLLWLSPQEEGVYSIKAELFPYAPGPYSYFPFKAKNSMTTELYVTLDENKNNKKGDIIFDIFKFYTGLEDDLFKAKIQSQDNSHLIGNPGITIIDNQIGFMLDGISGFYFPSLVLPVKDGLLEPFSIHFNIAFTTEQQSSDIIKINTADDSLAMHISLQENLAPVLNLMVAGQELLIPSQIYALEVGKRYEMALSIIPRQQGFSAIWILNHTQTSVTEYQVPINNISDQAKITIGGYNGIKGIIDLLEIVKQNQSSPYMGEQSYANRMKQEYGDNLLLADAFDIDGLAADYLVQGQVEIENQTLLIQGNSSLQLPSQPFARQGLSFNISLLAPLPEQGAIEFYWSEQETPFLKLLGKDKLKELEIKDNAVILASLNQENNLSIFENENSLLVIETGQEQDEISHYEIPLAETKAGKTDIIIRITNPQSENPLILNQISIIKR